MSHETERIVVLETRMDRAEQDIADTGRELKETSKITNENAVHVKTLIRCVYGMIGTVLLGLISAVIVFVVNGGLRVPHP